MSTPKEVAPWTTELAAERSRLERSSTSERVAEILRGRITDGLFRPGERMSEDAIRSALGISRNTLREAFRLLVHEGLVVHELNRGVFVPVLDADDVIDLYRLRRVLECSAIRNLASAPSDAVERIADAVTDGEREAAAGAWLAVGTANMRFHQGITELAGSPRISQVMRQLLAEMRLVFHVMGGLETFHKPYLVRHRGILELIRAGKVDDAEKALSDYLDLAEQQLVEAYRQRLEDGR